MAYFNHAFTKIFLGTSTNSTSNTNLSTGAGFVKVAGLGTDVLAQGSSIYTGNNHYGPGTFGFFSPKTWLSVAYNSSEITNCCPLVLASASLLSSDKIGPFHGGYKESNKSKVINPKYIQKVYRVDSCVPQQWVLSVGNTPYTTQAAGAVATLTDPTPNNGTGYSVNGTYSVTGGTGAGMTVTITTGGGHVTSAVIADGGLGYTVGDTLTIVAGNSDSTITVATITPAISNSACCFEFLCGETYYLRIDVKGSPALRALNHNAYQTVYAYTGCCPDPTPTVVDSTLVMIDWAKMIVVNNYLKDFIAPVVYDEGGVAWYAPGTTVTYDGTNTAVNSSQWWDAYVSPGHVDGKCAGMRLFGAFVETKFGNCSFQITDFFEKEPVRIYASMVDYNGDPCVFEGICVVDDCRGVQGMGFGEQVVRDLILSESYLQNFFATDIRIREITQGDQILGSVNRNALYTRYFILHSVPRFNNPTSTFDNDRYMLEIITNGVIADLETFLDAWLSGCVNCETLETQSCTHCTIAPDIAGVS